MGSDGPLHIASCEVIEMQQYRTLSKETSGVSGTPSLRFRAPGKQSEPLSLRHTSTARQATYQSGNKFKLDTKNDEYKLDDR